MSLEKIVFGTKAKRIVSIPATALGAISLSLSYNNYMTGNTGYAILNATAATLFFAGAVYIWIKPHEKSEETTGFFGVPDRDISDLERENHKRRGTVN